ncbi:MAG TPA: hypothetical protein PKC21_03575 [Oligoflexia bacterium]|nr:hypothetical protein [Oligoflexia bacterium]HMR24416.1 hypothetical protein [Oligoflexia bacterium]
MAKRFLYLILVLIYLQSCEEIYKEEEFNVIVPVMVQQQKQDQTELVNEEEQTQQEQENDNNLKEVDVPPGETTLEPTVGTPSVSEDTMNTVIPTETQNNDQQPAQQKNKNELSSEFTQKEVKTENGQEVDKKAITNSPTPNPNSIKKKSTDKNLDPREIARRKWLDLKNFASRRGFSQEDVNNLIPESLSIENYIKFGDIEKTNEKLIVIEEKLKEARVSRGYVKQKYKKILQKVANSQLTIDEKNDFNIRLKQVEKSIAENGFNSANRELNELEVDLGQVQTLDQVFEN